MNRGIGLDVLSRHDPKDPQLRHHLLLRRYRIDVPPLHRIHLDLEVPR